MSKTYLLIPPQVSGASPDPGLVLPPFPEPLSNLSAVQLDVDRATLSWDLANVPDSVTDFILYQDGVSIESGIAVNATSQNVANLVVGTTYKFTLAANTADGAVGLKTETIYTPQSMYGYPFASTRTPEPNVAAQWVFHQATDSANLVDEVAGLVLLPETGAAGRKIANVDCTKVTPLISPAAMGLAPSTGQHSSWRAADDTSLPIGTNDAVLEWRAVSLWRVSSLSGDGCIYSCFPADWSTGFQVTHTLHNTLPFGKVELYWEYDGAGNGSAAWTLNKNPCDGLPHHNRITIDRDGNAEYFIDDVSQGVVDISGSAGKSIGCGDVCIGAWRGTTNSFSALWQEVRLTIGNCTNNSY